MGAGIGSIVSGSLAGKAAKKQAKTQKEIAKMQIKAQYNLAEAGAADREVISQRTQAEVALATKQRRAAEAAQINVFSSLGTPGS